MTSATSHGDDQEKTPAPDYAAFWKHPREWKREFWKRERKTERLAATAPTANLYGARVYNLDVASLHNRGALHERRAAYRDDPNPSFATFGPKSRREFLALWDARGGVPG